MGGAVGIDYLEPARAHHGAQIGATLGQFAHLARDLRQIGEDASRGQAPPAVRQHAATATAGDTKIVASAAPLRELVHGGGIASDPQDRAYGGEAGASRMTTNLLVLRGAGETAL